MRPQVAERTGSGVFALEPPGEGRVGVDQPVLEIGGPYVPQGAEPALGDQLPCVRDRRHLAVVEADHRHLAAGPGPFRGLGHGLRLGDRVGERLLAQHVFAGLQGGDGDLRMAVAGRADVDELDVVPGDQGAPVCLRSRPAVPFGGGGDRRTVASADRGESRPHRQVEDVSRGAPPLGVGGAHERVSDHADPERRRRLCRRRRFGFLLRLFPTGHTGFLLVSRSVGAAGGSAPSWTADQLKPVGRYWSMLSLVTTAE